MIIKLKIPKNAKRMKMRKRMMRMTKNDQDRIVLWRYVGT